MTGILFAAIAVVAASVWIARLVGTRRARRRHGEGPGTSMEAAILVRTFDEIDAMVAARRCHCGERLRPTGEGSREDAERRIRFARLACDKCEEVTVLYFDVGTLLH